MMNIGKVRIAWTNLPLLLASVALLVQAWFLTADRDPGAQGNIMISMVLMVRAVAMPLYCSLLI
jgi:hypothetical protein